MNRQIARFGLLLSLVAAVGGIRTAALAATCTGADNCRACKNCRYCRHCSKEGGTCGVCKREQSAMRAHPQPGTQASAPCWPTDRVPRRTESPLHVPPAHRRVA